MRIKREEMKRIRQRQKTLKSLSVAMLGVAVIAALIVAFSANVRPALGDVVAIMPDYSHVAEGTDPGPYSTDPPTSGKHYPASYQAGFFHEEDVNTSYPAGYLVHSLEHGYVIFWYNCQILDEAGCLQLKADIQSVMEKASNFKVIAYPWSSIEVPVVLTSWGRLLRFEKFVPQDAFTFVSNNRNKAPEPHAD